MTLLEATSHLIDCARTNGHETDRVLQRAIKRMDQRLQLLKLRAAKTRRRNRSAAWSLLLAIRNEPCECGFKFDFGSFVRVAQIDGRGLIRSLHCPQCDIHLIGYRHQCSTCKERNIE